MTDKTKHIRIRIREILDELATPVMSDKGGAESWIKAIDDFEQLINQQVLKALSEVKKELNLNGAVIHECGKRVDGVLFTDQTLSAIEEIEKGYK